MTEAFNEITKPKHYNSHPSGHQAIEVCELIGFNCGAAFKYLFRCQLKHEAPVTDLEKAVWYLQREGMRLNDGEWIDVQLMPDVKPEEFDDAFFLGCWEEVTDIAQAIVKHESPNIAAAMAYCIRGSEMLDPTDLFIAASYVAKEISK